MSVVSQARLTTAIAAGKVAGRAARLLRGTEGTALPGLVARRIDPLVLPKVIAKTAAQRVAVTGSNGKTTTCRMIASIAQHAGRRVKQNRTGSNLLNGVTAVAVNGSRLNGDMEADVLVFEVDEGTMRLVVPQIGPQTLVVTNIFRDQLDRFGELYAVARTLENVINELPASATVLLNGDDPLVASFAPDAKCRIVYYGVEDENIGTAVPEHAADTVRCVRCQHDLEYRKVYISHLGNYRCANCGYARPKLDVAVTHAEVRADSSTIDVRTPSGTLSLVVPLAGLHNVYNAAAAIGAAQAMGIEFGDLGGAFATLRPAFGRLERIAADGKNVVLGFVKNPISYNTTLRTILQEPGPKHVLAAHSNTLVDGEDFAWLWDVDLEELTPQLASVVTSGTRAEEVSVRFKYAGVPESGITEIPDRNAALQAALSHLEPGATLYILAGYTPTRELRRRMQELGWVRPVWEE